MSAIEQILGEGAKTWLSDWIRRRNFIVRPQATADLETTLTDCQLDALRFLSGGLDATCGSNSTSYASCLPEKCGLFKDVSINDLWQNSECKSRSLFNICPSHEQDNTNNIRYLISFQQQWKGRHTKSFNPKCVLLHPPTQLSIHPAGPFLVMFT